MSTEKAPSSEKSGPSVVAAEKRDAEKRRLPVLQHVEGAPEEDAERPPWHWSAIGAVATFVVWLSLSFVANGALKVAMGSDPTAFSALGRASSMLLNVAAFATACHLGGYFVGRQGANAGPREATASGISVALLSWILAVSRPIQIGAKSAVIWGLLLVVLLGIGAVAARTGGSRGVRHRERRLPPPPQSPR